MTALPPLSSAQHPAERSPRVSGSSNGKRDPMVSNSSPSTVGPFVGLHGESLGSDYDREVGRDSQKPDGAHYHPKTLISCRPKLIVHSDQGTHWGAHLPAFGPQIRFASLLVWFAYNHEKS